MKDKKRMMKLIIISFSVIGLSIFLYYWYQGARYIKTQDARIAADTVIVSPQISGKITSWNITEGEMVLAGQHLGWQDTGSISSSSAVSVKSLNQTGSTAISKAEITAPISGKIIKSSVQEGQAASPGQTLAIIANIENLYVSANIEETKISKVRIGETVDFTIDAFPKNTFKGKVEEIGQATISTFSIVSMQSSSGSFTKVTQLIPVKIRFSNTDKLALVPGMSAEIKIHVAE
ncbi:MAG: HlyD family secretion protein [Peptococcaceae bacterium]|nr:HlyD family secretion protein [Peptococcaceae bacterium]